MFHFYPNMNACTSKTSLRFGIDYNNDMYDDESIGQVISTEIVEENRSTKDASLTAKSSDQAYLEAVVEVNKKTSDSEISSELLKVNHGLDEIIPE